MQARMQLQLLFCFPWQTHRNGVRPRLPFFHSVVNKARMLLLMLKLRVTHDWCAGTSESDALLHVMSIPLTFLIGHLPALLHPRKTLALLRPGLGPLPSPPEGRVCSMTHNDKAL